MNGLPAAISEKSDHVTSSPETMNVQPIQTEYMPGAERKQEKPVVASDMTKPTPSNAYAGPSRPRPSPGSRKLISDYLNTHPKSTPKHAMRAVFPHPNPLLRAWRRFSVKHSVIKGLSDEELRRYTAAGPELRKKAGWRLEGEAGEGVVVSELFWQVRWSATIHAENRCIFH